MLICTTLNLDENKCLLLIKAFNKVIKTYTGVYEICKEVAKLVGLTTRSVYRLKHVYKIEYCRTIRQYKSKVYGNSYKEVKQKEKRVVSDRIA